MCFALARSILAMKFLLVTFSKFPKFEITIDTDVKVVEL